MDIKTVEKVAKLARIELQKGEAEALSKDLTGIIKWVEQLVEVDTSKVVANEAEKLRFRKDEVTVKNIQEDVLKNAPKAEYGYFVVPKVIE